MVVLVLVRGYCLLHKQVVHALSDISVADQHVDHGFVIVSSLLLDGSKRAIVKSSYFCDS